jgi:hypothetical protein
MPLVAVTLTQPWATLMVAPDPQRDMNPPKAWETRTWYPRVLAPLVAIHAAKGIKAEERRAIVSGGRFIEPYASVLERCGFCPLDPWAPEYLQRIAYHSRETDRPLKPLPLGCIVGAGRIKEVLNTEAAAMRIGRERGAMTEIALGGYGPDRYAWLFVGVVPLREPVPCRGALQIWPVPDDVAERVRAQL